MSNEDIRWGSLGGLKEDPPSRIKDFGYTTSTGTTEGTSEAPILQWCNWQFAKTYDCIKDLTDLVNAGGGNNGGGDNGGGDNTGGTGGVNLIVNGDFAGGSTNWAFTGTTSEFTQVEDDASLSGYIATWQPTDNLSQMYYTGGTEIPIDLQNMVGLIEFDFKATSSNFTVEIYSATALLASHDIKQVSDWYHFRGQVPFDLAGQSVIVRFKCPTQAAGDILTLNNVRVGNPYNAGQSAIVGRWEPFTPELTNRDSSDITTYGQARRVGENLEIIACIQSQAALVETDAITVKLPYGLTSFNGNSRLMPFGSWYAYAMMTASSSVATGFSRSNVNTDEILFVTAAANDNTFSGPAGGDRFLYYNNFVRSGGQLVFNISVPIAEWQGQGTLDALESDRYSEDPAGGIMAYVGSELPFGWLECDGTEYLQGDYPELYTAIGNTYDYSQYIDDAGGVHTYLPAAADHFRVPNLKNLYLRGDGTSAVTDFLEDSTAVNGLAGHWTTSGSRALMNSNAFETGGGNAPMVAKSGTRWQVVGSGGTNVGVSLSGDAETRPTTGVVKYIIRAFSSKGPSMGLPLATDDQYGLVKLSDLPSGGGDGGSSTFEDLTDTPDNYTGAGDKIVSVKADESGLEFIDAPTGGGVATFSELTDTPISYTGSANNILTVNASEDGVEYTSELDTDQIKDEAITADKLSQDVIDLIDSDGDGVSEFTDLTDTPDDYTGSAGKMVVVKDTEDGLEYADVPTGGGDVDLSEYVKKGEAESVDDIMLKIVTEDSSSEGISSPLNMTLNNLPADVSDIKYYAEYFHEKLWGTQRMPTIVVSAIGMVSGVSVDLEVEVTFAMDDLTLMNFTSFTSLDEDNAPSDTTALKMEFARKHPSQESILDHIPIYTTYDVETDDMVDRFSFDAELGNRDNPLTLEEFNTQFGYYGEIEIEGYGGIQPDKIDVDALAEALPSSGGDNPTVSSALITDWEDITNEANANPSSYSNGSSPNFTKYFKRRVGENLEVEFKADFTGKIDDSEKFEFYLPDGLTSATRFDNCGSATTYNVRHTNAAIGQSFWSTNCQAREGEKQIRLYDLGGGVTLLRSQCESGTQIYLNASLPIQEWQGTGTTIDMNDALIDSNYKFRTQIVTNQTIETSQLTSI